MDLGFLDKTSNVTPHLVRLYDSQKLYDLAKDKKPLARSELTEAVRELLEMELSETEAELVGDVLIALVRQAEKDLRIALSQRLSAMEQVPLKLVLHLINDEIDVAGPMLENSPVLSDLDLVYIIKARGAEYWRAIAARKKMSDKIMDMLADTKDLDTAITLAENENILLSGHTLSVLSDIAQGEESLATPLLRRDEVTQDIAQALYEHVGKELRKVIAQKYEIGEEALDEAINDVVGELSEIHARSAFTPTESMLKVAESYHIKGLLTSKLMLETLRRGQMQSFIAQFSKFSALGVDTVESLLGQKNGQGLAVVCRATGIQKPDFVSMYLLTNRIRARNEVVSPQDMTAAVEYFNRIDETVAQGILRESFQASSE